MSFRQGATQNACQWLALGVRQIHHDAGPADDHHRGIVEPHAPAQDIGSSTHGTAVGQVPANTGTGQMADGTHMRSARNIHVEPLGHGTQCGAPIVQTPNH